MQMSIANDTRANAYFNRHLSDSLGTTLQIRIYSRPVPETDSYGLIPRPNPYPIRRKIGYILILASASAQA